MSKEFLPLGSAIKWKKDEESIYIIISRAFMQPPEQEMIAGYQIVLCIPKVTQKILECISSKKQKFQKC